MEPESLTSSPAESSQQDPDPVHRQGVREGMLQEVNGATASPDGATDEATQLLLQRESYHGTNQPLVAEGPSEAQAAPAAEELRSTVNHAAGGFEGSSVLEGLERFSAAEGPVKFQMWQKEYYRLLREGFVDTEAILGEPKSNVARRMKESYQSIQTDLHGDDHKLQAVQRAQEQATHEGAPSVGARLAEERKKAVRPSSRPLTRERELRSMSINRTLTAQEMDEVIPSGTAVGRVPRRSATLGIRLISTPLRTMEDQKSMLCTPREVRMQSS
jgi:hypothetical protein